MSKKLAFLQQFISKHRVALAIGMTATVFIAVNLRTAKLLDEFLKEHDLYDEYHAIEGE